MTTQRRAETMTMLGRAPRGAVDLEDVAIQLHPLDHVASCKQPLLPDTEVRLADGVIRVGQLVPAGHKLGLREVPAGAAGRRYGQTIGFPTQPIRAGEHVHTQNLAVGDFERDYAFCTEARPVDLVPPAE